jgi:hypothetical protein
LKIAGQYFAMLQNIFKTCAPCHPPLFICNILPDTPTLTPPSLSSSSTSTRCGRWTLWTSSARCVPVCVTRMCSCAAPAEAGQQAVWPSSSLLFWRRVFSRYNPCVLFAEHRGDGERKPSSAGHDGVKEQVLERCATSSWVAPVERAGSYSYIPHASRAQGAARVVA